MPTSRIPGLVDWSPIGQLPEIYAKGQERAREEQFRQLLAGWGGTDYNDLVRRAAQAGSLPGIQAGSQIAIAQAGRAHQQAQLAEEIRANKEKERLAGLGLEGKPVDHVVEDAAGNKRIIRVRPQAGAGEPLAADITPPSLTSAQPANPFATGKMAEHEGKSALFADRAATAHQVISKFENINAQPGGGVVGGGGIEKILPEGLSNLLVSSERGQMMNAKRAFINALLRRESGAAINAGEFSSYDKEYFPQLGDSTDQINSKRKHRAEVIGGLAREAGKSYRPGYTIDPESGNVIRSPVPAAAGKAPAGAPAVTKPITPAPAPGTIEGGHRFKGGDPSDPRNWEKV